MANYFMIPSDQSVVVDTQPAFGVDFTGIDPTIHAISWYDVEGVIEYIGNPITGEKPPNASFTDLTPYLGYISQANNIIQAYTNPQMFYATYDGATYGDSEFLIGEAFAYTEYPPLPAPPPGFTETPSVSATGEDVTLQWTGTSWVTAAFPYDWPLAKAQDYLDTLVNVNGSALINNQLRQYSLVDLLAAPDVTALVPTDTAFNNYPSMSLYIAAVDNEKLPLFATIASATIVEDLYGFSPGVPEPPVYTP